MSQAIELPDDVYSRLKVAAEQAGQSPAEWIEKRLPAPPKPPLPGQTMADLFGDAIGSVNSGGGLNASERVNELFGEYLEQKRREGRL